MPSRNVVLIVIDSLRAKSLSPAEPDAPATPFFRYLDGQASTFSHAYATECWTLPTHMSIFTGVLPSVHGAHFQTMAYARRNPTLPEIFAARGHHTEVITRNSLFDGTVPGTTRGFRVNTRPLAPLRTGLSPFGILLALGKPRLRRLMSQSGFFHAAQRKHRDFIATLVRLGLPADHLVLHYALDQM